MSRLFPPADDSRAMDVVYGLPADLVPGIDEPTFADEYDGEPGDVVVVYEPDDGPARAYPRRVLDLHHVVNDEVGGVPVAVTWCPLCGSGVVYSRRVGDRTLTFGFAGALADDNLVVRDRETGSEWKQSSGECIAGPMDGEALTLLPATMRTWAGFADEHPDGLVLEPPESPPVDFERFRRRMVPAFRNPGGFRPRAVRAAVRLTDWLSRLLPWGGRDDDHEGTNLGPFYRLFAPMAAVGDALHGTVAGLLGRSDGNGGARAYDEGFFDAYVESPVVGLPARPGAADREWPRVDFGPKTPVLGLTIDGEAVGFPEPKVRRRGGAVEAVVGDTPVVVFATPEGLFAYENPGIEFEPDELPDSVWGDGVRWDPETGEAEDGRRLVRVPARYAFAFAWADDHGWKAFYPWKGRPEE